MAKRLLGVDPLTGIRTFHHYDHATGKTHIEESQDCSKILKYTQTLANDSSYKRRGIKSDWYHFATLPMAVVLELKDKYHLDVFNDDDLAKIEKVIARDYKRLLTVDKL